MCEQQAHPESAASVPVQQGGTVRRKTMKHHIISPTHTQFPSPFMYKLPSGDRMKLKVEVEASRHSFDYQPETDWVQHAQPPRFLTSPRLERGQDSFKLPAKKKITECETMCCDNECVCILTDNNWQEYHLNAADVPTWLYSYQMAVNSSQWKYTLKWFRSYKSWTGLKKEKNSRLQLDVLGLVKKTLNVRTSRVLLHNNEQCLRDTWLVFGCQSVFAHPEKLLIPGRTSLKIFSRESSIKMAACYLTGRWTANTFAHQSWTSPAFCLASGGCVTDGLRLIFILDQEQTLKASSDI